MYKVNKPRRTNNLVTDTREKEVNSERSCGTCGNCSSLFSTSKIWLREVFTNLQRYRQYDSKFSTDERKLNMIGFHTHLEVRNGRPSYTESKMVTPLDLHLATGKYKSF